MKAVYMRLQSTYFHPQGFWVLLMDVCFLPEEGYLVVYMNLIQSMVCLHLQLLYQ